MEIYIIELPKVQRYSVNDKLDTWVNFIIKSGDVGSFLRRWLWKD